MKEIHVEQWVHTKERRNVELKRIIPHGLTDSVWPIMEWMKISMGSCKAFFLQVQPNFVAHLKDMHNHSIYDLGLAICLRVEGRGFGELGV